MPIHDLIALLKDNKTAIETAVKATPDWKTASQHFDAMFQQMSNPKDSLWSEKFIPELCHTYYKARNEDKDCGNITERTVKAMPAALANDTKKVLLQIANVCRIFNASHKVNFEAVELPSGFDEVAMANAKTKGLHTYATPMPSLYGKISLTFDYWVPKVLDWTIEVREKGFREWRGEASFEHESCTDFMRLALLFLSDPDHNLPICKPDIRQALLERFLDSEFKWVKKSAKREDIPANNKALLSGLNKAASAAGIPIPPEAWNRILDLKPVKDSLK